MAVHLLGGHALTIAPVGGRFGLDIRREFSERGVSTQWVDCHESTRVCTTIVDEERCKVTELIENARPLQATAITEFLRQFTSNARSAQVTVLTGSLPEGTPRALYRDLLEASPGRTILDISGEELIAALSAKPWLIKPNRAELERTLNMRLETENDLLRAMRQCNERGAEWVLVTQGADDVWLTSSEAAFRFRPRPVQVVNPIGCGDCLAGALAWATDEEYSIVESVKLGLAAAARNAVSLLPARFDAMEIRLESKMIECHQQ